MVKRLRHRPFTAVTRVRFPFGSPLYGRIAQLVRAPASHAGGQRFESVYAHQRKGRSPARCAGLLPFERESRARTATVLSRSRLLPDGGNDPHNISAPDDGNTRFVIPLFRHPCHLAITTRPGTLGYPAVPMPHYPILPPFAPPRRTEARRFESTLKVRASRSLARLKARAIISSRSAVKGVPAASHR